MLLVAFQLRKRPVSDMQSHNGYNTPTSRKSKVHWDYAQKIAPDIFQHFGKVFLFRPLSSCPGSCCVGRSWCGCGFRFQHFHNLVGCGGGGVFLEIAGHSKDGIRFLSGIGNFHFNSSFSLSSLACVASLRKFLLVKQIGVHISNRRL